MGDMKAEDFPEGSTLRDCGDDGCAALAKYWTESNFTPKSVIVSESDTDDDVFFVVDGLARAATFTDNGREVLYSDLPRGDSFGIFAAIDGQPRSTNVFAKEHSRIARLSANQFREVLYGNANVNRAFILYLVDRIRYLSGRMTEATTLSTEQRLCAQLLRSCVKTGKDTGLIEKVATQQEIATLISSQRESVGREMSKLKDQGLIDREGKSMVILSLRGLEAKLSDL
ncbi:MAG: Crp/Fnr family transcriptional regulator [Pseudomonadota bacterium]